MEHSARPHGWAWAHLHLEECHRGPKEEGGKAQCEKGGDGGGEEAPEKQELAAAGQQGSTSEGEEDC